jgi:hypothetical protein
MKLYRTTAAASLVAMAVATAACDRGLTDLNRNPNRPEDVPAALLLRPAIYNSAIIGLGWSMNINHPGLWVQHVAQIQYADEDRYVLRTDRVQAHWDDWYRAPLKDIAEMIEKGSETPVDPNAVAIGLVLKSWNFGVMTGLWGDLPYSEALSGDDGNFTPAYDSQQAIYNGLFADLKQANQTITGAGGFGAADLLYGGSMDGWRRFANSLRLRYAMHLTKVDPARARSEFEAAIVAPIFTSAAEEAKLAWLSAAPNQNPHHVYDQTRHGDHRVSATMIGFLKDRSDPRLPIYAQPIADDSVSYVGYGNGLPNNSATLNSRSRIGTYFLAPNSPSVFMSYSEVLFLRAEAALRNWNSGGGTAQSLYEAAVTANLKRFGIADAAVAAYLAHPLVAWDPAKGHQLIAEQKWASLYMQGAEAFTNWRRTGFPVITPGPAATSSAVPRRFFYPDLESSLNRTNLEAAVARQGDTQLWGRVWFDKP